jgi:hypothetical protein
VHLQNRPLAFAILKNVYFMLDANQVAAPMFASADTTFTLVAALTAPTFLCCNCRSVVCDSVGESSLSAFKVSCTAAAAAAAPQTTLN